MRLVFFFPIVAFLSLDFDRVHAREEDCQYEFRQKLDRLIAVRRDKVLYFGRLDGDGTFFHDPEKDCRKKDGQPFSLPNFTVINVPRTKPTEAVFEYRTGRLIKGVLNERGVFVPDLESRVIDFKDYRYTKTAPRIYNLPGVFVEKKADKAEGK